MNNNNLKIQEDAKSDWMKLVKKHQKRQKGLPALSTLRPDAGNVEHNVAMFNKMNTPLAAPLATPSSPPAAEGSGLGESVAPPAETSIELEYTNLPIEVVTRVGNSSGYYSASFGNWLPDDGDTLNIVVDWTYRVDKDRVVEFLQDLPEVQADLHIDQLSDGEYEDQVEQNFELLLNRYQDAVLDYFYDYAVEDAQQNYEFDPEAYYHYDPYDVYQDKLLQQEYEQQEHDDKFDMSMRSLL